jgi:hypothetical protein
MSMTRLKVWENNNAQQVTGEDWAPYIVDLGLLLTPGYTLLRTRVDLELVCYTEAGDTNPAAYPRPMDGWQTAAALCWSAEGPPTGYYEEVFADWIFVQQMSFNFFPVNLYIDTQPSGLGFHINTAETRTLDTKSMRDADAGSTVYLVVDSIDFGSTDSSQWIPVIQWTSRCLIEQPDM